MIAFRSTPGTVLIPPRGSLPKTYADDPLEYYYRPLVGRLYRARLILACQLLGSGPFNALLEIGYGSGILLPELVRRARSVVGIDVHGREAEVASALRALNVEIDLVQGSIFAVPFDAGSFDAVVCLSVLEHLTDLHGALSEMRRVAADGGVTLVGFPVRNPVTDAFFRLVGYDPQALHPSSHTDILRAIRASKGLLIEETRHIRGAYVVCRCRCV